MGIMKMLDDLEDLTYASRDELEKFETTGNKAAGTRVRKAMLDVKKVAQEIRVAIQDAKNKGEV
jgi:hypothetical protein